MAAIRGQASDPQLPQAQAIARRSIDGPSSGPRRNEPLPGAVPVGDQLKENAAGGDGSSIIPLSSDTTGSVKIDADAKPDDAKSEEKPDDAAGSRPTSNLPTSRMQDCGTPDRAADNSGAIFSLIGLAAVALAGLGWAIRRKRGEQVSENV